MKRIVVCFDGTWNAADSGDTETNVARMARAIRARPDGDVPQTVLYLRGVGSSGLGFQRVVDGAVGSGVDENIRSAYMFIAQNYVPAEGQEKADEIYLFGFSRGAFTARSLSGLIRFTGLLKRQDLNRVGDAWTYYRSRDRVGPEDFATRHGVRNHTDVSIAFMGIWDTVGALGIPTTSLNRLSAGKYEFHDTTPSKIVRRGYHALAVDEHRDEFVPTLWTGETPPGCHVEQMWFAGAHSDVGGGYPDRTLADIPLVWMAEHAQTAGLVLDWDVLPDGTKLDGLSPMHDSRAGWSMKDLVTPTFRSVCGRLFPVEPWETLFLPRDGKGKPLTPINEQLHPLLAARIGKMGRFATKSGSRDVLYQPRNL